MLFIKLNFILLQISKAKKNTFILSNTKNIYSFYKKISSHYYQYNKLIIFFMDNQDFFFSLKNYFYFLEFLKQYNFFFYKKKNYIYKKKNNINENILNHYNRNINNLVSKHINNKYSDHTLILKNKFFFYRIGIFFLNKKKNTNKKLDFIFYFKKKKISFTHADIKSIKFFFNWLNNKRKKLFNFSNLFNFYNIFFLYKDNLTFNINFFLFKVKNNFFLKKKKNYFFRNFNYYRYIYFYNYFFNKKARFFLKQKNISSFNYFFLSNSFLYSKNIIYKLKLIYSNYHFLKLNYKKKLNLNLNSNLSNIYHSNDSNIRSIFKNIYIYYFFLFYKKKIKQHFFSNLFNFFFNIRKERFLLKKKLTLFLNLNSIGIIYYKNTLKNVFLTLSTFKGKHLYHISSGHIKFFGRKKVFYKTIYNLTRRFLFKIKDRLLKNNIYNIKLIVNGFFYDVFVFLRPFFKKYYYFSKIFYIFKNYIFFLKKYLLYLKYEIKKKHFSSFFNIKKYLMILSHCYSLFSYIKYKFKRNHYLNIKLTNIQIKSNKFFSN